ncbi:hypothetical protein F0L68_33865 [Solihabitans fulvus]|uniref:Uncharacterized protein n=1 Tax=Solihabitans fulvus TaxID=1892852 RepID=A0A5B2WNK7_9PSEU|nr:YeeE/YedE thiosulfate transporter family protein [Solihabitans fulvus]KAA2252985.1 hypothetical protein F0L68_33865 [Solihabitans fulvus]
MITAVLTGLVAGTAMGYVLYRGRLCFHATFAGPYERRWLLARAWLLGVAVASVGLAVLFGTPLAAGLNRGLPFAPVADLVGGLLIGVGMAVARSCVSGLLFKLGSGMLGALVGLAGWVAGELAVHDLVLPGPTVLPGGRGATVPGVLGLPTLAVSVVFLVIVAAALRWRRGAERPDRAWQWNWPTAGVALGAVTVAGWVLAAVGGAGFGPSTVGAATGVLDGNPNWWLIAFLGGIVAGGAVAARTSGGFLVRGETKVRYAQLAVGGALLGAGGWLAGGCNLGHALSGAAQLNVSSWVVVAAIVAGIGLARAAQRMAGVRQVPAGTTY